MVKLLISHLASGQNLSICSTDTDFKVMPENNVRVMDY